ncbi:hypothetical protein [Polaribacter porphyrae]|uniref:Uncharacterized protein n=1 Tax=Polaribacter porphyrae TaxID=1137780 RepID=A0A2S7WJQ1_9FLAO|nr:hypothetical protein [Polaribacter porphyrae]PQJ77830.1 hypothetical protein BTO18_00910 [Polaribacter porphyrae]
MRRKEINKHCNLCEYQKKDFKSGSYCGVTDEVPYFEKKCDKIYLNKSFEKKVRQINIEYQKLASRKFDIFGGVILFPLIGFIILYLDYLFFTKLYVPFSLGVPGFLVLSIVFLIGFFLIAKGTGPLIFFKQQKDVIYKNKIDLDNICKVYGIEYEIKFKKNKNPFDQNLYIENVNIDKLK